MITLFCYITGHGFLGIGINRTLDIQQKKSQTDDYGADKNNNSSNIIRRNLFFFFIFCFSCR